MEQAFFLLKNQNERWDEIIREYNERKFDELMAGFHQRYSPNRSLRLTSAQNTSKYHPSQNIHLARKLANRENTTFRDHNLAMGRGEELPLETSMSKEPLGGRFVFPAHAMGLTPSQNVEFIDVPESKRGYPVNLFGFEGTPERYGKNQDPEGIIYGNLEEDSVHRLNKNPFMLRDLQRAASMFLPRSKNAPPSKIGLEGAQRHRARELAQMLMDAEIPGALIDPQTARAYGIESFQDIVPTKIGPDGKVISSITENLNDLTGNIGGGIDPLHGTFQQWERTYGPSGRVAELDETHTSPEQMQLLDDQLTAIPGAIMADPTQFYRSEPMDLAWRLLKVDDEIPDFSDEPVDQCEMCNKYLHDSDYHVLNDHNYCSDCYNQLAEPEEFDYDFQDKLTGEPMDIAMRLLKRQTNLGEHHEDFPSPYGPVVAYHGTTGDDARKIMGGDGLKTHSDNYRTISTNPSESLSYAIDRSVGHHGAGTHSEPKLLAIRQAAFDNNHPNYIGPSHNFKTAQGQTVDFSDATHYGGNIPRQFLTNTPITNQTLENTAQARTNQQNDINTAMSQPALSLREKIAQRENTEIDTPELQQTNQRGEVRPKEPRMRRWARNREETMDRYNQQMAQYMQPNPVVQPTDPNQQQLPLQQPQVQQPQIIQQGEPMDLAMRLLKMPLLPESVKRVSDNRTEAQFQDPKTNQVYPMVAEKDPKFRTMNVGIYPNQPEQNLGVPTALDAMDLTDKDIDDDIKEQLNLGLSNAELTETEDGPYYESDMTWTDPERRRRGYASALYNLVNQLGEQKVRPSGNQSDEGKQLWSKRMLPKGEPMEIAMQLLKERVSPEAKRHKLEYDKKYESSPERVKYREELNRERRRRHIMGQGGPDMSHTSQHTIVPEDPHTNRARHFKDKGTLL